MCLIDPGQIGRMALSCNTHPYQFPERQIAIETTAFHLALQIVCLRPPGCSEPQTENSQRNALDSPVGAVNLSFDLDTQNDQIHRAGTSDQPLQNTRKSGFTCITLLLCDCSALRRGG